MRRLASVGVTAAALLLMPTAAWAASDARTSDVVPNVSIAATPNFILTGSTTAIHIVVTSPYNATIDGSVSITVYTVSTGVTKKIAFGTSKVFSSGYDVPYTPKGPGNYTVGALYTPEPGSGYTSRQEYALLQVRTGGVDASVTAASATAGSPTPVTMTLGLPTSGDTVEGTVSFSIDADDGVATCVPVRTSPSQASCSTSLPSTITAGDHALTGIWADSPAYTTATYAGSLSVKPAKGGSGGSSGGSGTSGGSSASSGSDPKGSTPSTSSPTPSAATPVPNPTATRPPSAAPSAAAAGSEVTRPASSLDPILVVTVIVGVALLLALGALAAVLLVRRRHRGMTPPPAA